MSANATNDRTAQAVIGGSAIASALTTSGLFVASAMQVDAMSRDSFVAYGGYFLLVWFFSFLIAASAGLAWHGFASRRGWSGLAAYAFPAAAIGAVIPQLFFIPSAFCCAGILPLILGACGATQGGLTAVAAWLIRRPDRDAPNPPTSAL